MGKFRFELWFSENATDFRSDYPFANLEEAFCSRRMLGIHGNGAHSIRFKAVFEVLICVVKYDVGNFSKRTEVPRHVFQ